jgi:uncharacterized cofD-like protein
VTPDIVVITGMSGAGRSTAAKSLEDLGWFVVDNLPPGLLPTMADLAGRSHGAVPRIAAVVDVRSRAFTTDLKSAISEIGHRGAAPHVVFLEASDDTLVRRFDSVRRPHPLQGAGRVVDGIAAEREVLRGVRGDADLVIDTSALNVHELRARMQDFFGGGTGTELRLSIISFGFKYGLPVDADLVADCRFLPNPHWIPELAPMSGQDAPVRDFVLGQPGAQEFVRAYLDVLNVTLPGYEREGKRFVTLAIGCTGGKHRSVAIAEQLAARVAEEGLNVQVVHRDLGRELRVAPKVVAPKVVALGGGHGLAASLSALRRVSGEVTAIVTVADDGGSSGRLRQEFGVLPPGDLRQALAALCGDDDWGTTWSRVVQHRFGGDRELAGHSVGNLLIVALWELLGDTVEGLDWVGRLLGTTGRVLPMASVPLDIVAEVEGADPARPHDISVVRGQAECATTPGRVRSISLLPADPPAVPQAVAAVRAADWVVFGPGSWFTSVLPHLLVPELAAALHGTQARRLVALNLAPQPGETDGFSPHKHLEVLADHAPALTVDVVLADRRAVGGAVEGSELEKAAGLLGGQLILADVASGDGTPTHDPLLLAGAYSRIFDGGSDA